jgi:transcriptional repressor NrdR
MRCPFCHHPDTQVVETRVPDEGDSVRRRRRCGSCDKRFTTYERIDMQYPTVVKKQGVHVEFNPLKVRASMLLALRKRPVTTAQIDDALNQIEDRVLNWSRRDIPAEQIGAWVMESLKNLDEVAYIRFASVYKSFADVEAFKSLILDIGQAQRNQSQV